MQALQYMHAVATVGLRIDVQGCAKKLVQGWKKSSAQLQPAQANQARLVLNKQNSQFFMHNAVCMYGLLMNDQCAGTERT